MKKAKICIGTSNFGKLYGHNQDKFNKRDISKLFDYLKVNNLPYLDTAESYGNIGLFENKIKNFKLIYKINFKKKKKF